MGKLSELTTKTTPVWADLLTWLDSEDSNVQTKNKNFSLSSLWSAIFWSRTTTDIPEWSNLYYTDARVDVNSTVVSKEDSANKSVDTNLWASDILYPTQNAVKEYVDNNTSIPDATELVKGKARLATQTESNTWTDDTTILTPLKAANTYIDNYISSDSIAIIENQNHVFSVPSTCNVILIRWGIWADLFDCIVTRNWKTFWTFNWNWDVTFNSWLNQLTVNSESASWTYNFIPYYYVTL